MRKLVMTGSPFPYVGSVRAATTRMIHVAAGLFGEPATNKEGRGLSFRVRGPCVGWAGASRAGAPAGWPGWRRGSRGCGGQRLAGQGEVPARRACAQDNLPINRLTTVNRDAVP